MIRRSLTRTFAFAVAAGFALGAAGCGGGGATNAGNAPALPAVPQSPANSAAPAAGGNAPSATAPATVSLFIPAPSAQSAAGRSAQFVSPGTAAVAITVYSASATPPPVPTTVISVAAGSSACTAVSGGRSCTLPVFAPIGSDIFSVVAYDQVPTAAGVPQGNQLTLGSVTFTVANNASNAIALSLGGVVSSVAIAPGTLAVSPPKTAVLSFTVTAKDASGNTIVGAANYASPIALTVANDPNNTLTLSPSTLTSPANSAVTLSYNGGNVAGATLTASVGGKSAATASVTSTGVSASASIGSASTISLPPVGGYTASVAFPAISGAPVGTTIGITASASQPAGTPLLQNAKRAPQAVGTPSILPFLFLGFTPNNSFVLPGLPAMSVVLPASLTTANTTFYLAYLDPKATGWQLQALGPGVLGVSGGQNVVTFSTGTVSAPLVGGLTYYVALYGLPTSGIGIGLPIPGGPSQAFWVADSSAGTVSRFAANTSGSPAPTARITGLTAPGAVAFDGPGNLYVASGNSLQFFGAGSIPVSGSSALAPTKSISGSATLLCNAQGINTDSFGNVYVANQCGPNAVVVFGPNAVGNAAPLWTLGMPGSMSAPTGLVLDGNNTIYLADAGSARISVFPAASRGAATPLRTISGANTLLNKPTGLALDYAGDIIVTDSVAGSNPPASQVLVFGPGASGNVAPIRSFTYASGQPYTAAVASDGYGNILLAQPASVTVFGPNSTSNLNAAPLRTISSGFSALSGIAISPTP